MRCRKEFGAVLANSLVLSHPSGRVTRLLNAIVENLRLEDAREIRNWD